MNLPALIAHRADTNRWPQPKPIVPKLPRLTNWHGLTNWPRLTNLLVLTNLHLPDWRRELRPGLYVTEPYSMLVLVPGEVDPKMVHPTPPLDQFRTPVIRPPLRLRPKG